MGFYKASIRYIDLLLGFYNGNYPPENALEQVRRLSKAASASFRVGFGVPGPQTSNMVTDILGRQGVLYP